MAKTNQLLAVRRGWLRGQFFKSWFLRGVMVGFLCWLWRRMAAGGVTSFDRLANLASQFQRGILRESLALHAQRER